LQRILIVNRQIVNGMIEAFGTPISVAQAVAERAKQRRTAMRLTQAELAQKAGVSLSAYRRFEQHGQIAFSGLLQIAFALDCLNDFDALFASPSWATMDDMLKQVKPAKRVRHD
jgi:transcriptional regulator with XRE-family HTH domain